MLNILHLTIAARYSLTRPYQLSSRAFTLPFTSLTFLRLLFPISNLQSFLPSCTGGRNIRTGGTAMYISTSVTCNTTLHPGLHTCATTCHIPCPLIFTFTMYGYLLGSTSFAATEWRVIFLLGGGSGMPSSIVSGRAMSSEVG